MLKEALIKSHKRDWSAFVPCLYDQSRCGRLARDSTCLDRHKSAPVPRKRRSFIGLRQLQRLPRCAPCQGTYLGCGATPCIHLHLTQRASRDLISASLTGSTAPPCAADCALRSRSTVFTSSETVVRCMSRRYFPSSYGRP